MLPRMQRNSTQEEISNNESTKKNREKEMNERNKILNITSYIPINGTKRKKRLPKHNIEYR